MYIKREKTDGNVQNRRPEVSALPCEKDEVNIKMDADTFGAN